MIDYQKKFKQKFISLILVVFLFPPIVVLYASYTPAPTVKLKAEQSIKSTSYFKLRGTIRDIKISKDENIAYVVADSRGIYIIDIENPVKPKIISQFKYFKNSYDKSRSLELSSDEHTLFVRDAQAGLYSIDISNKSEPKLLSLYSSTEKILGFKLSQNTKKIYLVGEEGLTIADIKNPDEIKPVSKYKNKKYLDVVEANDELLYLLSSYGIDILDISKEPTLVGNYNTLGNAEKISLSKNQMQAFLSSGYTGVEILNISNKLTPKPLNTVSCLEIAKDTTISKDAKTIYISNFNDSLEIVDISSINNAKVIQTINTRHTKKAQSWTSALSNDEKVLYIANGVMGIKIIELE